MAHSEYYEKNRDQILEKQRIYYKENPDKKRLKYQNDIALYGDKRKAKQAEWRALNRDKLKESKRLYFQQNKEEIYKRRKESAWNAEKQSEYMAKYRIANKEKIKARLDRHKANDPQFYIRHRLRSLVRGIIKRANALVDDKYVDVLGCKKSFFISYIEALFKEGMTWENYGRNGWQIDHIVPCTAFDLTIEHEQSKCFHYTNLQPLWWHENAKKGNRIYPHAEK